MTDPRQPHPEDPWGQAPQAPPGPGRPASGPQPRQGGPPPDFGRRQGRHGSPDPQDPRAWENPPRQDQPARPDQRAWPDQRAQQGQPWPEQPRQDHRWPDQQGWPSEQQGWPEQHRRQDQQAWPDQRNPQDQPWPPQDQQAWPPQDQPWPPQDQQAWPPQDQQAWPPEQQGRLPEQQGWPSEQQGWPDQQRQDQRGWPDQQQPRTWQDRLAMPGPAEFRPPRSRNTGLMLALAAGLAVVLLGGGTVGAISYINATSGEQPSSAQATDEPSRPTSAPWDSKEPSEEQAPAEETPAEEFAPSEEPSEEPSGEAEAGAALEHTEFEDWQFEWEGVRYSAKKVGGWTYETCDPVDAAGVLARSKCQRAIQVAYSGYRGHLRAVQLTMAFPSEQAAKTAATRLGRDDRKLNTRRDMTISNFAYGKVLTHPTGNYVVTTIVTTDKTAERKALEFHAYLHANGVTHFTFRNRTVSA